MNFLFRHLLFLLNYISQSKPYIYITIYAPNSKKNKRNKKPLV